MNITLHAKYLYVQAGELHIGNKTNPYNATADIIMHGERNAIEELVWYNGAFDKGNKKFINVGKVHMFGK